jgi:hypothetical protein
MRCTLREVRDEDLVVQFEQWADPVAAHMAAFRAPDHMDRDAFEQRGSRGFLQARPWMEREGATSIPLQRRAGGFDVIEKRRPRRRAGEEDDGADSRTREGDSLIG